MSVLNKMAKGMFYVCLTLYMFLQSAFTGMFFSGAVLSIVLSVWTIIKPLPSVVTERLWLVYLLSAVPLTVIMFFYMLVDLIKAQLKKDNKQDNGNH
jgi:hypothetical protein